MNSFVEATQLVSDAPTLISSKAEMTGPLHLLAIFSCVVAYLVGDWIKWVEGTLILASTWGVWSMRKLLVDIRAAHRLLNERNAVLANHIRLNMFSAMLFVYAFCSVWRDWPLSVVAVFLASALNYAHYAGYRAGSAKK